MPMEADVLASASSKDELVTEAKAANVEGADSMTKAELADRVGEQVERLNIRQAGVPHQVSRHHRLIRDRTMTPDRGKEDAMTAPTYPETTTESAERAVGTVTHSAADEEAATATADTTKHEVAGLARAAQDEIHKHSDEQTRRLADQTPPATSVRNSMGSHAVTRLLTASCGSFVRQAADKTGQFAQRLDEGGIDRVTADVKQFARQRPGLFLTSAFGLGVVAGRTLRNADTRALVHAAKPSDDAATPSFATPQ